MCCAADVGATLARTLAVPTGSNLILTIGTATRVYGSPVVSLPDVVAYL